MPRAHRVTHPSLGVVTWKEIQKATPNKCCRWCHEPVPAGSRTRCRSAVCAEMIWRAYSPMRVARQAIKRDKATCVLCGNRRCMIEVDHIVPVSLGGAGDIENLRALCDVCHGEETARLRTEKELYVARKS